MDNDSIDIAYLDIKARKAPDLEATLKKIGIDGKKSLQGVKIEGDKLDDTLEEVTKQAAIVRKEFQSGVKSGAQFEKEMRGLEDTMRELYTTQDLNTKQLNKLTTGMRTARASLDTYEGKISKLGLAHNVAIANTQGLNKEVLNLIPGVSNVSGQLGLMSSAGLGAGGILGGALAIGAGLAYSSLKKSAAAAAEVADEIDKTAGKVGVGVEEFQRLSYWADQNGISSDQLRQGLGDLNTRVGQAILGNKTYQASFERLGVSLVDANGKTRDTDEILEDLVGSLSNVENAAERTALAGTAFGEEFSRVVQPALAGGIEGMQDLTTRADELGLVLDAQTVSTLVNYKDRMAEVDTAFRNAGIGITVAFLPILENMSSFTITHVVPAMQSLADYIQSVADNFVTANTSLNDFMSNPNLGTFIETFKKLNPFLRDLPTPGQILAEAGLDYSGGTARGGGWGGNANNNNNNNDDDDDPAISSTVRTVADALKDYNEQLALNNQLTDEALRNEKNLSSVKTLLGALLNPSVQGTRGSTIAEIEAVISSMEAEKEALKSIADEAKKAEQEMAKLQAINLKYDNQMRSLQLLFNSGAIDQKTLDKQQLSLVQSTVNSLADMFSTGVMSDYSLGLYDELVASLPVLKKINEELKLAITPSWRELQRGEYERSIFLGGAVNTQANMPENLRSTPTWRELQRGQYERDTFLNGSINVTPNAEFDKTVDAFDIVMAEAVRDVFGLGNFGSNAASSDQGLNYLFERRNQGSASAFAGHPLNPTQPIINLKPNSNLKPVIDEVDKALAAYIRGSVGIALYGQDAQNLDLGLNADFAARGIARAEANPRHPLNQTQPIINASQNPFNLNAGGGLTGERIVQNNEGVGADLLDQQKNKMKIAGDELIEQQVEAGERFKELVAQSAVSFGQTLADDLRDGKLSGSSISGLGSFAGSLAQGAIGGPAGILAAGGISLFSSILGGFLDDTEEQRKQSLASQNRALPALSINLDFVQNNQYSGRHTDAAEQSQYTRNANQLIQDMSAALERTVIQVTRNTNALEALQS